MYTCIVYSTKIFFYKNVGTSQRDFVRAKFSKLKDINNYIETIFSEVETESSNFQAKVKSTTSIVTRLRL